MNTNTEQAEGLSMGQAIEQAADEKAAGMAALLVQVEATEGAADGQGTGQDGQHQGEQEPQRAPLSVEFADAITTAVTMLEPIFPTLGKVYTPATVERIGMATERVCIKRGWLQNGLFGGQTEELMLAAVLVPVALSTWAAVKADLIAAKVAEKPWLSWVQRVRGWFGGGREASQEKGKVPDMTPGAATVTMGTVAPA